MGYQVRRLEGRPACRARFDEKWAFRVAADVMVVCGLLSAGCSAGSDPAAGGDGTTEGGVPWPDIVQADAFDGFCKWSSAPATAAGDAGDGVHGLGPLTVYWSQSPPHGSHEFPVGTIILKESNQTNPADRLAFAMVKRQPRGTGYNTGGADGWEWWSVQDLGNCQASRLWRGPVPPSTESYAGQQIGDCNGCHAQAVDNDYVWDTAVQLSHF
jgi:hypothetical protein